MHTFPTSCIIFAHICHTIHHHSADLKLGELSELRVLWSRVNGASSMFITDDVTGKMAGLD